MESPKGKEDVLSQDKTAIFLNSNSDANTTPCDVTIARNSQEDYRQATKQRNILSKEVKDYLQFLIASVYWKKFTLEQANECFSLWAKKFPQENFYQFLLSKKIFSPQDLGTIRESQNKVPEGAFEISTVNGFPCILGIQGMKFGKYILEQEVGRGGMGVVYSGYDPATKQKVAVKRLAYEAKSQESIVQRFLREANTLQKLSHPNIVPLYELGWAGGNPYYVMAFIQGKGLDQLELPLSYRKACKILTPVAEALHYAHQHAVIHRDIKPSNIILDNEDHPWLTDFGLAKDMSVDQNLTAPGAILGTPFYMAPEQLEHANQLDFRCDIYSLGAVLYQLLSGHFPFSEQTIALLFQKILKEEPLPLSEYQLKLPSSVVSICEKAMAKKPEDRYKTASLMAKDLRNAVRNPKTSQYRTKTKRYPLAKFKKPSIFIGLGLFFVFFCIFLLTYGPEEISSQSKKLLTFSREKEQEKEQEKEKEKKEEAIKTEQNLLQQDILPSSKRVRLYIRNKEFSKALSMINYLISQDNKDFSLYSMRAEVYMNILETSAALQDIEKAISLNPKKAHLYRIQAEILRNMKRYQDSLQSYNKAISMESSPAFYLGRGALYSNHLGEHQKAIQDFEKCLALEPKLEVAYYNMGVAHSKNKNYPKSIESYSNAIQINRNYFEAYMGRGTVYCDTLKEYEKALEDFNWAISLDPKCYESYCNRAVALAHLHNYTEALETCNFAIGLQPELSKAYYLRGRNHYQLKNHEKALDDFEKALEKNSPYTEEIQDLIKKIKGK
ncbi:MAG: protein kinase [Candidatus Brocadiae bacterium]|nr:protein kinase [Candidatus Brocadiia bacterium]